MTKLLSYRGYESISTQEKKSINYHIDLNKQKKKTQSFQQTQKDFS